LDRSAIPPTVASLRRYIDSVIRGGILRVTEETMRVAELIRQPPPEVPWRPVLRQVSKWAFGTLPPALRTAYGVRWSPFREIEQRGTLAALKAVRPAVPSYFREIFPAREARRRMEQPA
jgi:uncharacterized protein (DUF2236 family)